MSYEIIVKLTLLISFSGIATIIFRKLPILVSLPEIQEEKRERLISIYKRRLKNFNPFKKFSYENFLEKIVYKIRLLSLKTDNKTFQWLQELRKKTVEKKKKEKDNYWEEIKKKMNEPT
ncbi:hypothetical protein AMJ49_03385 [Parcubacteria bacterium DG_74_2]|nr:MAG: hypothetical protein AMJ49_03385 [Parcubacteria bacterium DG_74_2]